jgi:hypothetical protein
MGDSHVQVKFNQSHRNDINFILISLKRLYFLRRIASINSGHDETVFC